MCHQISDTAASVCLLSNKEGSAPIWRKANALAWLEVEQEVEYCTVYQARLCLIGLARRDARSRRYLPTPYAHTLSVTIFASYVCWFPIVRTSWVLDWVANHKTTTLFCCKCQLFKEPKIKQKACHYFLWKPHLKKGVGPHFVKIGRICIVYVLNCALFQVLPSSQVSKTLKKYITL